MVYIGRIDRIGQEFKPVYYHLVMERTIDDKIYEMVQNKVEFSEKDLDELNIEELNVLHEIFIEKVGSNNG